MSLARYAKKQDANAASLVKLARQLGMIVEYTDRPLDFLVWTGAHWYPVECKTQEGKYTKAQTDFMNECEAIEAPTVTWWDETDVVKTLRT
jgi:hypothetical protein